jgi:hypothetical protein
MNPFLSETLSRERMAALLAEADQARISRAFRPKRPESGVSWHLRLLAPFRSIVGRRGASGVRSRGSGSAVVLIKHSG